MTFQESIDKFCDEIFDGTFKKSTFVEKLVIVEKQWGLFISWIIEKKNDKKNNSMRNSGAKAKGGRTR